MHWAHPHSPHPPSCTHTRRSLLLLSLHMFPLFVHVLLLLHHQPNTLPMHVRARIACRWLMWKRDRATVLVQGAKDGGEEMRQTRELLASSGFRSSYSWQEREKAKRRRKHPRPVQSGRMQLCLAQWQVLVPCCLLCRTPLPNMDYLPLPTHPSSFFTPPYRPPPPLCVSHCEN